MHYVIAAKALRKVFISVKGIYYQVEIKGQPVTILINHQRGFKVKKIFSNYLNNTDLSYLISLHQHLTLIIALWQTLSTFTLQCLGLLTFDFTTPSIFSIRRSFQESLVLPKLTARYNFVANSNCLHCIFLVDETSSDEMATEEYNELVAALNLSLVSNVPQIEEELQIDEFPTVSYLSFF